MKNTIKQIMLLLIILFTSILYSQASLIEEAQKYYKTRQILKSLRLINKYLHNNSNNPDALLLKSILLYEIGKNDQSIEIIQGLLKTYPGTPELYNNLATAFAAKGDYINARTTLQKAVYLNPKYKKAQKNLDVLKLCIAFEEYINNKNNFSKIKSKADIIDSLIIKENDKDSNAKTLISLNQAIKITKKIQQSLNELGYNSGEVDGVLGKKTISAIKKYQLDNNLNVDGKISESLLQNLNKTLTTKKLSDRKENEIGISITNAFKLTLQIQEKLYEFGYDPGPADGMIGKQTIIAIKKYQKKNQLEVDGKVSQELLFHMNENIYEISNKWTIVPIIEDDCSNFISLKSYIENGYKPVKYIGHIVFLKNKDGIPIILATNPDICRNISRILTERFKEISLKHQKK